MNLTKKQIKFFNKKLNVGMKVTDEEYNNLVNILLSVHRHLNRKRIKRKHQNT